MKKYLLMAMALMTSVATFADTGWAEDKRFTPVASYADLDGVHTTVAADGSVYASSTINKQLKFGASTIEPEGGLLSSCVVKYNAAGEEQWAVLLYGKSTINSMATDASGNCYVTGSFMDSSLDLQGTDGNEITLTGNVSYLYGFVAKITADGKFVAAKTIQTNTNAEIASSEFPFYLGDDIAPYLTVEPMKIKVDGNNVYVSLSYKGDVSVDNVTILDGAYSLVEFMMYVDTNSKGIVSFNASDLSNPQKVACIQMTDNKSEENAYYPEAMDFVVNSGLVGVTFIGFGNLTLSTPTQSKNFTFEMKGEGVNEHGMVLSMLTDVEKMSLTYHATPYDNKGFAKYNLFGEMIGTKAILGGTFYGSYPLDNTVTKDHNTSFLAAINVTNGTIAWNKINETEAESVVKGMIVTGEEAHIGTEAAVYHYKVADGTAAGDAMPLSVDDASHYGDTYACVAYTEKDKTDVRVWAIPMSAPSAVEAVKAATVAGGTKFYGIDGAEIAAPQKGVSIVKTADGVKKIIK